MNDIQDDGKQLSVCGASSYTLIRNLVYPVKPSDKSFEELCDVMRNHTNPKPSEFIQHFKFNSRVSRGKACNMDHCVIWTTSIIQQQ